MGKRAERTVGKVVDISTCGYTLLCRLGPYCRPSASANQWRGLGIEMMWYHLQLDESALAMMWRVDRGTAEPDHDIARDLTSSCVVDMATLKSACCQHSAI